jgi:uncharacterized protein YdhG (YjbR/CyaY superfamily)
MDGKGVLKKILLLVGCFVLLILSSFVQQYLMGFGGLVFAGIVYGTYILFRNLNEEYEYIYTNGEIDIDVIRGKSVRKRKMSIKPSNIEVIAKTTGGLYESYKKNSQIQKRLDFSDGDLQDSYFTVVNANGSKNLVVFSPSERLVEALRPYLRDKFK